MSSGVLFSSGTSQALAVFEKRLGHIFQNKKLFDRARTHRSFSADHNERLEFLGDTVLNLAVSEMLYRTLDTHTEGDLSRIRSNWVCQETLARLALDIGLDQWLRLSTGEEHGQGRQRPSILADALEAVLGAIFLDAGYGQAAKVVQGLFAATPITPNMAAIQKDPKTRLQEWLHKRKRDLPIYQLVASRGAAHNQVFEIRCVLTHSEIVGSGYGQTRRQAEQAAAQAVLTQLEKQVLHAEPRRKETS